MTFESPSDTSASLSDKGSKVMYVNKNEAADGLGMRLDLQYNAMSRIISRPAAVKCGWSRD